MVSRRQTILGDPGAVSWVGINGGERDITLNKPAPRLIRMLVSDWAQKNVFVPNRGPASIVLLSWSFLPAHSTVRCILPYLSGSCSGAFFEKIFQWEWGPKAEDTHNRNERYDFCSTPTFIMQTCFDFIHINYYWEKVGNCCMHNKCWGCMETK